MRTYASLAVACGVHVALMIAPWTRRAPPAGPEAAENPAPPAEEWDLDVAALLEHSQVSDEVLVPETPETQERKAEENTRSPTSPSLERAEKTELGNGGNAETPMPAPSGSAPSPAASGEGWAFSPTVRKPVDLGIGPGGASKYVLPDANGTGTAKVDAPPDEPRRSTTGGLVEALDEEDMKRGMNRGAPVKLAVEAAARSTAAPSLGKATFDISVGIEGGVQIHLSDANNDYEGWNRLAEAIRGHLARKRVRIPPGSKGLRVVVQVEAREQLPDGSSPGASPLSKVGVTPGQPGVGYSFSTENVGVAPVRVVSSRIVRETRF